MTSDTSIIVGALALVCLILATAAIVHLAEAVEKLTRRVEDLENKLSER